MLSVVFDLMCTFSVLYSYRFTVDSSCPLHMKLTYAYMVLELGTPPKGGPSLEAKSTLRVWRPGLPGWPQTDSLVKSKSVAWPKDPFPPAKPWSIVVSSFVFWFLIHWTLDPFISLQGKLTRFVDGVAGWQTTKKAAYLWSVENCESSEVLIEFSQDGSLGRMHQA